MSTAKRAGDKGMTSLAGNGMVSKADERIGLISTIEELNCYIGGLKASASCDHLKGSLERIQRALVVLSDGVKERWNKEPAPALSEVAFLEQEIERIQTELPEDDQTVLPGQSREASAFEMAAAITRRAEHQLIIVDRRYSVRAEAKQFMNRLSDYFCAAAKYQIKNPTLQILPEKGTAAAVQPSKEDVSMKQIEMIVRKVVGEMGQTQEVTLQLAKTMIEEVEKEAVRRGMSCVICVCNPHGNPVAVHVMDGAFLVSFDAAIKKAYSAVAVKMPTLELAKLAAPGGTFYGVEQLDGGKMTVIGGGVPLICQGRMIGGIGVSGGTGEEDDSLAKFAAQLVKNE